MRRRFLALAFTPAVRAAQARNDPDGTYADLELEGAAPDALGPAEAAFIAARDGFYMASVGETGWPYVQFRGGPPGFLRVLDPRTLAFADLRGNRQYISVGNLGRDDRVALFLMDYAARRRLKLFARATIVDDDPELLARLATDPGARAERAIVLRVEGFDWNCPQHIPVRHDAAELARRLAPLQARIAALEAENAALRGA